MMIEVVIIAAIATSLQPVARSPACHRFLCSVTDAPPGVAEHVLDAHHWNLDAAVSFYLESGGVGFGTGPSGSSGDGAGGAAVAAAVAGTGGAAANNDEDDFEVLEDVPGERRQHGRRETAQGRGASAPIEVRVTSRARWPIAPRQNRKWFCYLSSIGTE